MSIVFIAEHWLALGMLTVIITMVLLATQTLKDIPLRYRVSAIVASVIVVPVVVALVLA